MSEDSTYKTLDRYRTTLIYITNQIGLGILSLQTAMQTVGLVPCIITVIGMDILVTYTAYVLLQFQRRYSTVFSCVDCFIPRKMRFMADFGIIATISILAAVLIVMIALGVAEPNGARDREINLVGTRFTSVLNIAFAYAGNQAFVTVMAEMKDPSKHFLPSISMLQVFAIPMYTVVGVVTYAPAGQYTTSPALGSAPIIPSKVAYEILLPILLGTTLIVGHTSIKYIFVEVLRAMNTEHEYDRYTKRTWVVWVTIGTTFWVLAFILANAIPVSLALFVSWFTLGIPGVMWLYLNWDVQFYGWKKTSVAILNWAIIAMTLFMTGVGLWASIDQLIELYNDRATSLY